MSESTPEADGSAPPGSPAFVVTPARSGSTMLRWLLDSHPDIACPSESDVAKLAADYLAASARVGHPDGEAAALSRARAAVDELMGTYARGKGKPRWCEKSLTTIEHIDLAARLWPEARFIFLYRHGMDFVGSALEAQPWGLSEYGFGEFAKQYPTDNVAALVAYWHDRTARMLEAETRLHDRFVRIRYEDLVSAPDAALSAVWELLGVAPATGLGDTAFDQQHDAIGPADHKIWQTSAIHQDSVGRGARIPPGRVVEHLRVAMNRLLAPLGYPLVDQWWGCGGPPPAETSSHPSHLDLRIVDGHRPLWRSVLDLAEGKSYEPSTVEPPRIVAAVERRRLPDLVADSGSLPSMIRSGYVRWYGPRFTSYAAERAFFSGLAAFLSAHGQHLYDDTRQGPQQVTAGGSTS